MENELNNFLAEGMKKYKEASRLMVLFGKNIEKELQDILSKRTKWGIFLPDETKKKRSTTFWHEYPLLNADIFGKINNKQCTIRIAINWYSSETDYPYYIIILENGADEEILKFFESYNPTKDIFIIGEKSIQFNPDPNDFNLNRDFNIMIDEFIKVFK